MGMSLVVRMDLLATFVPALAPMYGIPPATRLRRASTTCLGLDGQE